MRVVCAVVTLFVVVAAVPTSTLTEKPELDTQSTPVEVVKDPSTPPDYIPFPSPPPPNNSTLCQRRSLNVSLADLKWDGEIIAPKTYDAGYCSGACPESVRTPHAIVLSRSNLADEVAPKPCCVPTELEPIAMLYCDQDLNIIYSTVQDMMVKTCGCR